MLKRILKITGIILLSLTTAVSLIPFLFKGKITSLVKKEINKSLNAKFNFDDISISFFRHFPKVSISINEPSVVGLGEFANDTLVVARSFDASVNLISLFKGKEVNVYGVYLESPRIHAIVTKEGKANWDIAKEDTKTSSPDSMASAFQMKLKKYRITDGYLNYRDEIADMYTEIFNLNHEGSGDFTQNTFTLSTTTNAAAVSFTYDKIPWLINTKTGIDADIRVDNSTNKYSFQTDNIYLNNLKLSAKGFLRFVNDSTYDMDIEFHSPGSDFKDILSLVPAVYKKDFDKIKTGGKAVFNGFVKGIYSPDKIPAYNINLEAKDGFFQNPDLPKQLKNIQLAMNLNNPDGITDHAVINIPSGHFEIDNEPFDFRFLLKNPETNRYIDAAIKGKLDLSNISKLVRLEQGTKLSGLVWADLFARGNLTVIENNTSSFAAGGFLDISNLYYAAKNFPQPIQNGNIKLEFENAGGIADKTAVNIPSAHIEIGKDPLDFTLRVTNPVSTLDFTGTANGSFTLDNIKQIVQLEPGTIIAGIMNADLRFSGNKAAIDKKQYDKIKMTGDVNLKNLNYVSKDYPAGIKITHSSLQFNPDNVILKDLSGNYMKTNFSANGIMHNVIAYAMENQPLSGSLNLSADKMNLNEWLGNDTASDSTAANAEPFLVPADMDLTIHAKADKVKYDKVEYNNIDGSLLLNDESIKLQNISAEALDGVMNFSGSYSTKTNKKQPAITLSYDVKDVDVQKAFYAFNTMQKLMPIGQFIAGKLSSRLSMTGNLNGDMVPDFSSLTGNGNLLLLQGVLKKFAPLEKLASTLQIDELKEVSLKDIKNYIEFANGKVLVKPFPLKVKDIEMQIGGMHGFDQSLDYIIQMKVPRKYLGAEGNALLKNLVNQANNKGIPAKLDETVNLSVKMSGSVTNPLIKTELKEMAGDLASEMKQQAVDFAKQKVDSTKNTMKDSLMSVKKQVTADLKSELTNQLFAPKDSSATNNSSLDSTKKKAETTIKNTLKGLLKKKKDN